MRNRVSTLRESNLSSLRTTNFTLRANRLNRFGLDPRSYLHEAARPSASGFEGNER